MRPIAFLLSIILLTITNAFAQNEQSRPERFRKIETAKIAYITKELVLTPEEAEQFFPLYHQYQDQLRELMHRKHNRGNQKKDELQYDADVLALKKKYQQRFNPILNEQRSAKFFEVEREFREQLFKELRERKGNRR